MLLFGCTVVVRVGQFQSSDRITGRRDFYRTGFGRLRMSKRDQTSNKHNQGSLGPYFIHHSSKDNMNQDRKGNIDEKFLIQPE